MPIGSNACRADADHDYQDLDAHSIRELHGAPPLNSVLAVPLIPPPEHGVRRVRRHHPTPTPAAAPVRNTGYPGHQDRARRKPRHAATAAWPTPPGG